MERRSFLAATASAALAFPFIACSRKAESGVPPGFLQDAGLDLGHRLRDHAAFPPPSETRRLPLLIVGAGIAGLSAGWRLQKKGYADFRIVELANRCGGNSRFTERESSPSRFTERESSSSRFTERGDPSSPLGSAGGNPVSAHPLGAHYLPLPTRESVFVRELLADLGALTGDPTSARPSYDETKLCHAPQERLYRDGMWYEGVIPQHGLARGERDEIRRFVDRMAEFRAATDGEGRRAFALPADLSSPEPRWRDFDRISMADWLRDENFRAPALLWYVDYACRDDFGTTLAETSAWAGIHYFACRNGEAANAPGDSVLTAPEGNGWIVRALSQRLAGQLATDAMVFRLQADKQKVLVDLWLTNEQRTIRYEAQHLIWAAPVFLLPFVTPGLPAEIGAAARAGTYAPWLVANLTLDEPPGHGAGAALAWDNVPYRSAGLGYVVATHQNLRLAPGPTVITWYHALAHTAPAAARKTLAATSREMWAENILKELGTMHHDIRRITRRVDVFRHGHAMIRPTPGALWGRSRATLLKADQATPYGQRIHLAHSDLSGLSLFEEANYRGVMAADKLLRRLG